MRGSQAGERAETERINEGVTKRKMFMEGGEQRILSPHAPGSRDNRTSTTFTLATLFSRLAVGRCRRVIKVGSVSILSKQVCPSLKRSPKM